MENDVFKTNPVFQNLSPEKLSFLMNFANSKKPTEMKDMMPFLLGTLLSHTLYDACFHLAISYQIVATFTFSTLSIGATLVPLPSVPSKYFELADSNKT